MRRAEVRAYWHTLIAEYEKSGKTQREFAEAHGIGEKRFSRWLRKLREAGDTPENSGKGGGLVKLVAAGRQRIGEGWACRIEAGTITVHLQERPPAAWVLQLRTASHRRC